ncbi:MAG: cyclophilin-like fold protein [Phycisphaerae bacterium]|nr:cyclophilin-like fold protein [Tepidisphaeraceae bacterium]
MLTNIVEGNRRRTTIVAITAVALTVLCACDAAERVHQPTPATNAGRQSQSGNQAMSPKLQVKIGQKTFTATLEDNSATVEFRRMLPLTLDMPDLNANEKHVRLPGPLPTDPFKPGTIRAGDLLLWGDDTLVLFYETFRSPYSYTRLGKLDDPTALAEAVGSGSVTVTFEAK